MPPEPAFVMGLILGTVATLLIQLYGRRKASAAAPTREVELLVAENGRQSGQILRLEERLATLERIAVDPAYRTAREIAALR